MSISEDLEKDGWLPVYDADLAIVLVELGTYRTTDCEGERWPLVRGAVKLVGYVEKRAIWAPAGLLQLARILVFDPERLGMSEEDVAIVRAAVRSSGRLTSEEALALEAVGRLSGAEGIVGWFRSRASAGTAFAS